MPTISLNFHFLHGLLALSAASYSCSADLPAALSTPIATALVSQPRILRVGVRQSFLRIASAAAVARDGDTVEIDAGDYVADTAVWAQDRLTLRGVGGPVRLIAAGLSAEGKAIWVIKGGQVTVENISFSDAKVPDANGAGIRFEQGRLTVRNCRFLNNENGLLTANAPTAELTIENSEFGYNGSGSGQSHNLYVGSIKKLTVTGSYFHHAKVGHLLKTRAAENHIFYNRLTDETGGSASYELEFPNGGLAYVVGNIIQQASSTQNSTLISYGAEGYAWPKNELYLSYNTLVDDYPNRGIFLRRQPGLDKLLAFNNLLVGEGPLERDSNRWGIALIKRLFNPAPALSTAEVQTTHNLSASWEDFVQASRFDYRPQSERVTGFTVLKLNPANGIALEPNRQYTYPTGTRPLTSSDRWPGAVQK